jgi:hypothetical protein
MYLLIRGENNCSCAVESKADLYEKGDQLPFQIINCSRMGQKMTFQLKRHFFNTPSFKILVIQQSKYAVNP